jgi:alpha-amylase
MAPRVRLVLAIHNHQPVGNFDGVFEAACADSYIPFLDVLQEFPQIPISLHISGSLLEWLVKHRRDYIDRVRDLVKRGQIEMIGGPFYEPILACIPRRDRIGQIAAYSRYLRGLFGSPVRGMWVPERVWEQSFASDIAAAGIEYTILDDFHFKNAGLRDDQLSGYYLTEDEGQLLKLFPGSERLRYTIPFADPQETIAHLRDIADRVPNAVVAFGDDGEKFGTWPGTKAHVYQNGWLKRFFETLVRNADWLQVTTMGQVVDQVPPAGKCYIPDSSYREMTEWALPTPRQTELHGLVQRWQGHHEWPQLKQYLRGGFWRNFRVKYPESNEMYARMLDVSRRLEALSCDAEVRQDLLNAARSDLYRGQCNCPYWHGAFGGLYLPHLRNAIYSNLISADNHLEAATERVEPWVEAEVADYNLDARKEVRLAGDRLVAWLAPSRGGHLYELDVRSTRHNLLATLDRRPEPYHETVRHAASRQHEHHGGAVSIHDLVHFKQPDLDKKIVYDNWPRKSLVDHFLQPGLPLETFQAGQGAVGDFTTGVYETRIRRSEERVEAQLTREGQLGPFRVTVTKTVALDVRSPSNLEVTYRLDDLPAHVPIHFAVEFNFAGMAAGAPDRYYYDGRGRQLGQLESVLSISKSERIGLVDEWLGVDVSLETTDPAEFWTMPVQTVSQSEAGFELVHQSSAVVPHWEFTLQTAGPWSTRLTLSVDTSAAQARILREREALTALS